VVIPTYNGARRNANLTPLLALLLQRYGVPVLLHGLSDDYGRVTSEQVLREYGLPPSGSLQEAQLRIDEHRLAYLPLPLLAPGLDRQLALRHRLGLRNSAHSLVKMLDPFQGEAVLLAAATHPDYLDQHACRAHRDRRQCAAAARQRRRTLRQSEAPSDDRAYPRRRQRYPLRGRARQPQKPAAAARELRRESDGRLDAPRPRRRGFACRCRSPTSSPVASTPAAGQPTSIRRKRWLRSMPTAWPWFERSSAKLLHAQAPKCATFFAGVSSGPRRRRFADSAGLPANTKKADMKRQRATIIVEIDSASCWSRIHAGLVLLPGRNQPGGIPLQAAARELAEETGLIAESLLFLFSHESANQLPPASSGPQRRESRSPPTTRRGRRQSLGIGRLQPLQRDVFDFGSQPPHRSASSHAQMVPATGRGDGTGGSLEKQRTAAGALALSLRAKPNAAAPTPTPETTAAYTETSDNPAG
jgi:hypothetical protein